MQIRKIYKSSTAKYKEPNNQSNYIYMYNRDKTILYYCIRNPKEFQDILNIHYITFEKHLTKGTYYLGRYLFTGYLVLTAKFQDLSLAELALMLKKDRVKFKRKKD